MTPKVPFALTLRRMLLCSRVGLPAEITDHRGGAE